MSIRIRDLEFEPFIEYAALQNRISILADAINAAYDGQAPLVVPILNGAFRFAADLTTRLRFPYQISFVKVASYHEGVTTSGKHEMTLDIQTDLAGRSVLLVDDIADSGLTLDFLVQHMKDKGAADVKTAVLFLKPDVFAGQKRPDWVGFEIGSEFIVGYGLDYAEEGRNLNDVYRAIIP